jgi:hypothetical protein
MRLPSIFLPFIVSSSCFHSLSRPICHDSLFMRLPGGGDLVIPHQSHGVSFTPHMFAILLCLQNLKTSPSSRDTLHTHSPHTTHPPNTPSPHTCLKTSPSSRDTLHTHSPQTTHPPNTPSPHTCRPHHTTPSPGRPWPGDPLPPVHPELVLHTVPLLNVLIHPYRFAHHIHWPIPLCFFVYVQFHPTLARHSGGTTIGREPRPVSTRAVPVITACAGRVVHPCRIVYRRPSLVERPPNQGWSII